MVNAKDVSKNTKVRAQRSKPALCICVSKRWTCFSTPVAPSGLLFISPCAIFSRQNDLQCRRCRTSTWAKAHPHRCRASSERMVFNKKCAVLVHRGAAADRHTDLQIDNDQGYIAALSSASYIKMCFSKGVSEQKHSRTFLFS